MNATPPLKESREVALRFIKAYDELKSRGLVKTKLEFCKNVGLHHSGNLRRLEEETHIPTLNHIFLLIKRYKVSVKWLMLGEGNIIE